MNHHRPLIFSCLITFVAILNTVAAEKKIVFIAGSPSHGPLQHEHRAGLMLLKQCLDGASGLSVELHTNGWVDDESALANADAIVLYSDGGGGNPFLKGDRIGIIGAQMKRGAGLGCIHYAVEPTREKGQSEFIDWIGGAFEIHHSINPHWEPQFNPLPIHPVTRGVKTFSLRDEWYYHMRFRENMKGVTPILSAVPPLSTLDRPDGPHSGNPSVRAAVSNGEPQHVMWVVERENGGRGFGFTGGHFHNGWGNEQQRRLVLNSILWIARLEVPDSGFTSHVSQSDLMKNLDPK